MAQQLRALADLPEDSGSVPRTHTHTHIPPITHRHTITQMRIRGTAWLGGFHVKASLLAGCEGRVPSCRPAWTTQQDPLSKQGQKEHFP